MAQLKKEEEGARPNSGIVLRVACGILRPFFTRCPTPHALRARLPGLAAQLIFWPLTAAGVALDLWSKRAAFDWLQQHRAGSASIIDGLLQFVTRENDGAAFSIASGQTTLLVTVSIVAMIVAFAIFLFGNIRLKLMQIGLALFTAGIVGNLYDRIFNDGLVRDFIDVYYRQYHWPAFNIADSMLCVGVGLMIISSFRDPITEKSSRKRAQQHK